MVEVTREQVIKYDHSILMALVMLDDYGEVWVPYHQLFIID